MTHDMHFPALAAAPAFGVRVADVPGGVLVQIADSGGRGFPHVVVFLPVEKKDEGGFAVPGVGDDDIWANLKAAGAVMQHNDGKTPPPYRFTLPYEEDMTKRDKTVEYWPTTGQAVLVLLVYIQSHGVGAGPPQAGGGGGSPQSIEDQIAQAVGRCLRAWKRDDLRGGLIEFAAGTKGPPGHLTFAVGSCLYPSDIFDRMPDGGSPVPGPADAALLRLSELIGRADGPTLLLLVGDQVYIDATAGLFDPKVIDDAYRIPYQRLGESRGVMEVMQRRGLRIETMLDDHELQDNWAPNNPEPEIYGSGKTVLERGRAAYCKYQRLLTAPLDRLWRDFTENEVPFFVGDSRTERDGRDVYTWDRARIMRNPQMETLQRWLISKENMGRPKFVLTPSALLPRSLFVVGEPAACLHADAWDGYPRSLYELLAYICDNEIKGVVFLSGDEHICNFVEATVTRSDKTATLHSIHSSALYAPYPFANAVKDDFAGDETFLFPDPDAGPYTCTVKTTFPREGDGFAIVKVLPDPWSVEVTYYDAGGAKHDEPITLQLTL